jgi:hypothetical protein
LAAKLPTNPNQLLALRFDCHSDEGGISNYLPENNVLKYWIMINEMIQIKDIWISV